MDPETDESHPTQFSNQETAGSSGMTDFPSTSGHGTSSSSTVDTTTSRYVNRVTRDRVTDKWICTFQIMDADFPDQGCQDPVDITDDSCIGKIDDRLKKFFHAYNIEAKKIVSKPAHVLQVLGSRYIYHPQVKLAKGVLMIQVNSPTKSGQFNCHLLVEKFKPMEHLPYQDNHKIYIGHAYPIHTQDVSCIGGNSLRRLLNNWVDELFYERLHWIIPKSTKQMRFKNQSEAEDVDLVGLKDMEILIKLMKKTVGEEPRTRLFPRRSVRLAGQDEKTRSVMEFLEYKPGEEYKVKSHHWETIHIPKNADGTVNERAYRIQYRIQSKGGKVRPVVETRP